MSNFKHSFFRTLLYAQLLSGFSGVAIAAQISLSVKDRPMREVIKELEETTEYRFFYNDGIKGLNSPISVDVEDADINAVMDAIAKQANVAYVLKSGHQIVLSSVKTVQQQGSYRYDYRPERGTNHRGECGRERIYQWYHHGYRWSFLY